MPTIISLAKSTQELNNILDLRFHVYAELRPQSRTILSATQKLIDPLDVFPTTKNILATEEGRPVGAIRISEIQAGNPTQGFSYSFDESAKNMSGRSYILDMFCVDKSAVKNNMIIDCIFRMALKILSDMRVENAFFLSPKELVGRLTDYGFEPIQNSYFCEKYKTEVVPLKITTKKFLEYFEKEFKDKELLRFKEIFYYSVYSPGEIMAAQGERGISAFLITEGEVHVLLQKDDSLLKLATLSRGSLIGEIAMLTSEPRTASLVATQYTSCIVFDRAEFLELMYAEPHRSLDIFKIFSKRLADSNRKLVEVQNANR